MLKNINTILLRRTYDNISIVIKIIIFMIAVAIIPLFIIGCFTYNKSQKFIIKETYEKQQIQIHKLASDIKALLKRIDDISTQLITDDDVQKIFSNKEYAQNYSSIADLGRRISAVYLNNSFFKSINIYPEDGIILRSPEISSGSIEDHQRLKKYTESLHYLKPLWIITQADGENQSDVSYVRKLYDIKKFKYLGIIEVKLHSKEIKKIITDGIIHLNGVILVADEFGGTISGGETRDAIKLSNEDTNNVLTIISNKQEGNILTNINYKELFIAFITIPETGWKIVNIRFYDDMMLNVNQLRNFILFIGAICIILAIVMSILISNNIIKPIKKIIVLMRKVEEGNLNVDIDTERRDEIGKLGKTFKNMMKRMKILIDKLLEEENEKRKAEIAALQAQISPHFLFNTINSIMCLANIEKKKDIATMCSLLLSMLKIRYKVGSGYISIRDEIEYTRQYVELMQYRYGREAFKVFFNIDSSIESFMTPCLIIQPIVENSILHGIDIADTNGMITVSLTDSNTHIRFTVSDNGKGMNKDEVDSIFNSGNSTRKGIGLSNVYERLKLNFGSDFSMDIDSSLGKGTIISFVIPKTF